MRVFRISALFSAAIFLIGAVFMPARPATAELLEHKSIPLALASEAAATAVEVCAAEGYNVTVTVLDRAGTLKTFMRADAASQLTVEVSQRKAITSARLGSPSGGLAEQVYKSGDLAALGSLSDVLFLQGGLPIRADGQVVGAIGVSGAPSGQADEDCAAAGIKKIEDRLK